MLLNIIDKIKSGETSGDLNYTKGSDSFVASYCKRVLIIKDGQLYQEIVSGGNRRAFQQEIVDAMSLLGGEPRDII